ncbi:MAG: heme biosynthesis HemY N-terminal domain-containing protein [Alphaproteobacteria bacterium]
MIRALVVFSILVVVAAAAAWFADHPGEVTIHWLDYRIDTSFAVLAAAVGALVFVAALLLRLWLALVSGLRLTGRARLERRRLRGYRALTQGMVAVAAGDAEEAKKQARRADVLLAEPPLTLLLSAQAAQLSGDTDAARKYFSAMLDRPETAFLGLRGLLNQKLRDQDVAGSLLLAQRAYTLRPRTPWLVQTLFELQARSGHWTEAFQTLKKAVRQKTITAAEGKRRQAIALFGQSRQAAADGRRDDALALLRRSHKSWPHLVPVTAALAYALIEQSQSRRAHKVLERAWAAGPHPDLTRAFFRLVQDEEPLDQVRRLAVLEKLQPGHLETHLALAEAATTANLWGEARRHLKLALLEKPVGRRACRLMAKLEESEHRDVAAGREWLGRAAEAEADPAWVCERCATEAASWGPVCGHCGAVDSLLWGQPSRLAVERLAGPIPAAASTPRLPLSGPSGTGTGP